jgi:hypothetical protein
MKYDLIIIKVGMGIPDGDLSPQGTGMGKKCPPQAFVGIPAGNFFCHGDRFGELKPDGEFPVAITISHHSASKGGELQSFGDLTCSCWIRLINVIARSTFV